MQWAERHAIKARARAELSTGCVLQARLAITVLEVFMPDTAGESMSGRPLSSAALQLLPLVLTTQMCSAQPSEPVDHQATGLVRPTCDEACN